MLVPIGTGGMATVYLARTEVVAGASREVAIKVMHAKLAADVDMEDGQGSAPSPYGP